MKERIAEVLEMLRDGKLNQAEAADVIAALVEPVGAATGNMGGSPPPTPPPFPQPPPPPGSVPPPPPGNGSEQVSGERGRDGKRSAGFTVNLSGADNIAAGVGHAVRAAVAGVTTGVHSVADFVRRDVRGGVSVVMGKVEDPTGERFVCEGNSANLAQVSGVVLNDSTFTDNRFNACTVRELKLTGSTMTDCEVNGASVDAMVLETSRVADFKINGAKTSKLRVVGGSAVVDCQFNGTSVREWTLEDASEMRDVKVNGASCTQVRFVASTMTDTRINASSFSELLVERSAWTDVEFNAVKIAGLTVRACHWKDVSLRGQVSRDMRLERTRIERCNLSDVKFVGCTFKDTVLEDIELADEEFVGLDLTGMTIRSAEELRGLRK